MACWVVQAGVDSSQYSGQSFRKGAATATSQAGYSDSFIQSLGRWKSATFISYIRTSTAELATVAPTLARVSVYLSLPFFFLKGQVLSSALESAVIIRSGSAVCM